MGVPLGGCGVRAHRAALTPAAPHTHCCFRPPGGGFPCLAIHTIRTIHTDKDPAAYFCQVVPHGRWAGQVGALLEASMVPYITTGCRAVWGRADDTN